MSTSKESNCSKKSFKCDLCNDYAGTSNKELNRHKRTHEGTPPEKSFFCNKYPCEKSFASILSLKQHKMAHLNEKKYYCKICQKKFAWKRSLDDHKKRHMGEWNWSCDYCSKGFISHFQMMKHIRNRHTLEKLFTCNICGKSFEGWDSLKIHKSVHSQQKMFQCNHAHLLLGKQVTWNNTKALIKKGNFFLQSVW